MKLVNKNTTNIKVFGEIVPCNVNEYGCIAVKTDQGVTWYYRSLAELNEEWEDYEEPKTEFYITAWGDIREYTTEEERFAFKQKLAIGNYFETREEAEKAVEKLKCFTNFKNHEFMFDGWYYGTDGNIVILANAHEFNDMEEQDLTKVFGEKIC